MATKKPKPLQNIDFLERSTNQAAADRKLVELLDLNALSTNVDALSADGQRPKVHSVEYIISSYQADESIYALQAFYIQTAGNMSDAADINSNYVHEILGNVTDDIFGYEALTNLKVSLPIPPEEGHQAPGRAVGLTFRFRLPPHIIALLNKEAETERLQESWIVLMGHLQSISNQVVIKIYRIIDYTLHKKGISIR